MATSYPGGLDNFTNPTAGDLLDSATVPHADQHANINDAVEAIETELGTNPKGGFASVAARLDTIDTTSGVSVQQYGAEGSVLQNIPTRLNAAEQLLKQAVWWIDSAHSGSSGQAIKNLGWGGAALDATAGSTTAADSNDPKYLDWDGINYVYLPGVGSNILSIPDAAALDIVGDIDIRAYVDLDNWTTGAFGCLISKDNESSNISYSLNIENGTLRLDWSADGTTRLLKTATTTVAVGAKWVRATLDVDNGAAGNDVKFYTSNDGTSWTQVGSTVTTAGVTSIYSGTANVAIGAFGSNNYRAAGKIYRAQILNGIGGVPVLDVDTSVIATGAATSFTALTGQTVTINRSTSGRKTTVVTHPVWLFGTDDFMEVNNRWLEHTGSNYLYLPGVQLNNASTPDSAALDITGDIDLRVKVALDDWTPVSEISILGKWEVTGFSSSYLLDVATNGTLKLIWSTTGSNVISATSTVATGIADGATKWVRATFDVDNGASGYDAKFFTSDDGSAWTQLGTTVTGGSTTSIFSGTGKLEIGTYGGGLQPARGKFYRAQVLNGIGGTVAFDANFETGITTNLPTTFTESSANAATVTINYSGTAYRSAGVTASTYVFPGATNTFKLSSYSLLDFGATESLTALVIVRQWGTAASSGRYIQKGEPAVDPRYRIATNAATTGISGLVSDGTNGATTLTSATITYGSTASLAMVLDRTAITNSVYINAGTPATLSTSTVGSLANINRLRIGATDDRTTGNFLYQDFEFVAAAIFRRALTAAEIATLNSYFQGRVA